MDRFARRVTQRLDMVPCDRSQVGSFPTFRRELDKAVAERIRAGVPVLEDQPLRDECGQDAVERAAREGQSLRQLAHVKSARIIRDCLQDDHELRE